MTAVTIDPSDTTGNTVYVAAASGGVWQSTNAASAIAANVTWTALTDQQASLVNGAVSVKPDGSVVLVGTGEPDSAIDSYYGVGILRSIDHGATWTLIPTATGNNPALSFGGLGFGKFAWDTSPATTVVAATGTTALGFDDGAISDTTSRGLYYSNDSGQTWTFETPQDAGVAVNPASISATDVVYNAAAGMFFAAIRYHGVYSSTNGQNWTRLANQPNPTALSTANCPAQIPGGGSSCPIYRGQLAVVPGRNEMYFWFVSLTTGPDGVEVADEGIWQSTNGGTSWTQIDETGIANCGDPGNIGCGVDQGYYNLEIAAVPDGQAVGDTDLYAGTVNLFKCELLSGSQTCSTLDSNLPNRWINLTHVYGCNSIAKVHPDEHGVAFALFPATNPTQAIMYFANDGGVYRTLNGYTLLDSGTCGTTNGFDNLNASSVANGTIGSLTQFVSFSLHPTDQNTLLGGTQDNGSPATSSATENPQWITVNGGDGGYNAIDLREHLFVREWRGLHDGCIFANGGERGSGRRHGSVLYAIHPRSAESFGNAGGNVPCLAWGADGAAEFLDGDQRGLRHTRTRDLHGRGSQSGEGIGRGRAYGGWSFDDGVCHHGRHWAECSRPLGRGGVGDNECRNRADGPSNGHD